MLLIFLYNLSEQFNRFYMREQQSDLYEVVLTYDKGNSTYKPE